MGLIASLKIIQKKVAEQMAIGQILIIYGGDLVELSEEIIVEMKITWRD